MDDLAIGFTNKNRLAGQRFGRLTVIEKTTIARSKKSPQLLWRCLCDCGNFKLITKSDILKQKSCGCLSKEKDLTGKWIGIVYVKYKWDSRHSQSRYYCHCLCGNQAILYTSNLIRPNEYRPLSCGCRGLGIIEKFVDKKDDSVKWRLIETKQVIPIGLWEE